jgi:flagellar biosynthesis/type III secretory pathway protein FliH
MPETLTINLARPVAALRVVDAAQGSPPSDKGSGGTAGTAAEHDPSRALKEHLQNAKETEQHRQSLAQSCRLIDSIAGKLNELYDQTLARNRGDIARLAVEIARKVLAGRISKGDYDLQPVIEEALKRAPARQEIVIRVNPEDLPQCQQLQRDNPDSQLADLNFAADWSIARADCLIETPKGIVKSFVEEHLARIADALERAQQA